MIEDRDRRWKIESRQKQSIFYSLFSTTIFYLQLSIVDIYIDCSRLERKDKDYGEAKGEEVKTGLEVFGRGGEDGF